MAFDPDAYLKQAPNGKPFDPDAYLKGQPQEPPAPEGWHVNEDFFNLAPGNSVGTARFLADAATRAAEKGTSPYSEVVKGIGTSAMTPLLSAPDVDTNKLPDFPLLGSSNPRLLGHMWNMVHGTLESFESPGSLATIGGVGGIASAAKAGIAPAATALRGISGAFTALAAYTFASQAPDRWKTLRDPNTTVDEKGKAIVGGLVDSTMTVLGALGTIHKVAPDVAKELPGTHIEDVPGKVLEAAHEVKDPAEKLQLEQAAQKVAEVSGPPEAATIPPAEVEAPIAGARIEEPPPDPAVPQTPSKPASSLVGIKNEAVDAEMKAMGLSEAEHGPALSWAEALSDAQSKLTADPLAGSKLVDSLAERPRPITGQEDALLLSEVNRVRLERDAAESDLVKAKAAQDPIAIQDAQSRIAKARDDFAKAEQVATQVGTPQAQGLALRRMMMREDYSLASMERQLAAETASGKITEEQTGQIKTIAQDIRDTGEAAQKHEAQRLKAYKTRIKNLTEEYEKKVAAGDTSPRPKPEPLELDAEGERLKAMHQEAKDRFQKMLMEERWKNASFYDRAAYFWLKWRRGFLLSNPITLAKLSSAAAQRAGTTAAEEGLGRLFSKVPGLGDVAAKAPRYGDFNANAEARAWSQMFTQGMRDSWDILTKGKSQLETLYGKGKDIGVGEATMVPKSVMDFFGRMHGALKAPVKRAEFERSFEKRMAFASRNGENLSSPFVQLKAATGAYKDANASIFLQDNFVTDAYKRALSVFYDKPALKPVETLARTLLPIVKVPTNIVGETIENVFGLGTGSVRFAKAMRAGVENLGPEEADLIMRQFRKGSLGAIAMAIGWFGYKEVGGYYQPGEKRKPDDVAAGSVRVFGVDVPPYLLHSPIMNAMQFAASMRRVAESKLRKRDRETQGYAAGALAATLGLIEEVPFAREAVELAKMFDPKQRPHVMANEARDLAVPQAVQFVAKQTDKDASGNPIIRKPDGVVETIESGIPGLRQDVPAKGASNRFHK